MKLNGIALSYVVVKASPGVTMMKVAETTNRYLIEKLRLCESCHKKFRYGVILKLR